MYIYAEFKRKIEEAARPLRCLANRYGLHFCLILIYARNLDKKVLDSQLRCSDEVVKLDDEHFAILFITNKIDGYVAVANKLFFEIERALSYEKFSMGVACSCQEGCDDVIATAIRNLFEAKDASNSVMIDDF